LISLETKLLDFNFCLPYIYMQKFLKHNTNYF
jgi:hypothetical protein